MQDKCGKGRGLGTAWPSWEGRGTAEGGLGTTSSTLPPGPVQGVKEQPPPVPISRLRFSALGTQRGAGGVAPGSAARGSGCPSWVLTLLGMQWSLYPPLAATGEAAAWRTGRRDMGPLPGHRVLGLLLAGGPAAWGQGPPLPPAQKTGQDQAAGGGRFLGTLLSKAGRCVYTSRPCLHRVCPGSPSSLVPPRHRPGLCPAHTKGSRGPGRLLCGGGHGDHG